MMVRKLDDKGNPFWREGSDEHESCALIVDAVGGKFMTIYNSGDQVSFSREEAAMLLPLIQAFVDGKEL